MFKRVIENVPAIWCVNVVLRMAVVSDVVGVVVVPIGVTPAQKQPQLNAYAHSDSAAHSPSRTHTGKPRRASPRCIWVPPWQPAATQDSPDDDAHPWGKRACVRETGAFATENSYLRDTNLAVIRASDQSHLEIVAPRLPLARGIPLGVDAAIVSLLHANGTC